MEGIPEIGERLMNRITNNSHIALAALIGVVRKQSARALSLEVEKRDFKNIPAFGDTKENGVELHFNCPNAAILNPIEPSSQLSPAESIKCQTRSEL